MSRQKFCVATRVGLRQDISIATGHGMSRQCLRTATQCLVRSTRASTRDQATLSAHIAEGRARDEFCHNKLPTVFFHDRDSLSQQTFQGFLSRQRIPEHGISHVASWNMGFSMSQHRTYVATMHCRGARQQSALSTRKSAHDTRDAHSIGGPARATGRS